MKYISIAPQTTLSSVINMVGRTNTQQILSANDLMWTPNVGDQFSEKVSQIIRTTPNVNSQRKSTILNGMVSDDDVFEKAALASQSEWRVISTLGTFQDMIRVPETISLPDSADILGSGIAIKKTVYNKTMQQLQADEEIDPANFNEYSSIKNANFLTSRTTETDPFEFYKLPWGKVTLHSSISDENIDFPVYPEDISDGTHATYSTMPDLLYQYEPWQLFESSGPRSNTYKFHIHRDMWTGDHRDGLANRLIRFCQANCYGEYNGSLVNTAIVTLYVEGSPLIRGVLTDVTTDWSGPIGLDGFYLECNLSITITEVSSEPLNYTSVRAKPLIG